MATAQGIRAGRGIVAALAPGDITLAARVMMEVSPRRSRSLVSSSACRARKSALAMVSRLTPAVSARFSDVITLSNV